MRRGVDEELSQGWGGSSELRIPTSRSIGVHLGRRGWMRTRVLWKINVVQIFMLARGLTEENDNDVPANL